MLRYGHPFPFGEILEGISADDHWVFGIVPTCRAGKNEGEDYERVQRSHAVHAAANLPQSTKKSVGFGTGGPAALSFTAWGTQFNPHRFVPGISGGIVFFNFRILFVNSWRFGIEGRRLCENR